VPHVVTISPKRWPLARAKTRAAIRAQLLRALERYRPEFDDPSGPIRLHFSPRSDLRAAKEEVAAVLDAADRRWGRAFDLYVLASLLARRLTPTQRPNDSKHAWFASLNTPRRAACIPHGWVRSFPVCVRVLRQANRPVTPEGRGFESRRSGSRFAWNVPSVRSAPKTPEPELSPPGPVPPPGPVQGSLLGWWDLRMHRSRRGCDATAGRDSAGDVILGDPAPAGSFISGYGSERIAARSESQRCVRPDSVTVMVEAAVGVQLACIRWHSRPAGVTAVYAHM
jgi:hypothetical protein